MVPEFTGFIIRRETPTPPPKKKRLEREEFPKTACGMLQEGIMTWVDWELQKTQEEVICEAGFKRLCSLMETEEEVIPGWKYSTNHSFPEYFSIFPGKGNFSEPRTPSQTQGLKGPTSLIILPNTFIHTATATCIWDLMVYLRTCDTAAAHFQRHKGLGSLPKFFPCPLGI